MQFTELRRLDLSCMAHSVEPRCPFLDREVRAISDAMAFHDLFEGSDRFAIQARLRYRIGDDKKLSMWFDLDRPHLGQVIDPIQTLMLAGHGRDLSDVIIDGRFVMVDRQIPGRDEVDDNRRAQRQFEGLMRKYPERTVGHPPIDEIFSSSYLVLRADRPAG